MYTYLVFSCRLLPLPKVALLPLLELLNYLCLLLLLLSMELSLLPLTRRDLLKFCRKGLYRRAHRLLHSH